jgi:hypothetical protein
VNRDEEVKLKSKARWEDREHGEQVWMSIGLRRVGWGGGKRIDWSGGTAWYQISALPDKLSPTVQ